MRGTYPGEVRVLFINLLKRSIAAEAAEQLEISASSAVRWLQHWHKQSAFLGQNHAEEAFLRWSGMRSGYSLSSLSSRI